MEWIKEEHLLNWQLSVMDAEKKTLFRNDFIEEVMMILINDISTNKQLIDMEMEVVCYKDIEKQIEKGKNWRYKRFDNIKEA